MPAVPVSLAAPYRPVRAVSAPESPFDGVLARGPDDRTVLLVDRNALRGWAGWGAPAGEHLFAVLDVVRRADGHDVVLPMLAERLDRFLARRGAAGAPVSEGELVTITVSVLRGVSASGSGMDRAQWWLDDEGRPVLVPGRGDSDPFRESADVLRTAAGAVGGAVGEVVAEAAEALESGRRRGSVLRETEDALFAQATPEPLATTGLVPLRAARQAATAFPATAQVEATPPSWWHSIASRFDADLSDAASDAVERLRRRLRRTAGSRRAPLLVAVGIAVVVVAGGMLWPSGDGGAATGDATAEDAARPSASAEPAATGAAPPATTPAPASADGILTELLDRRAACPDEACLAGVVESTTRPPASGAIDLPADARAVTVVDDLGGLVVLRVAATDGSAAGQLVTIVETPQGWRIRDAYPLEDLSP